METSSTSQDPSWQAIRRRYEHLREKASQTGGLTPEQADTVMAERARQLARVPERAPDSSEILELMIVQLADERFALETRFVREVQNFSRVTPMPDTPDHLLGVANLRGDIIAVLDLRPFFALPTQLSDGLRMIILGDEGPEFGICVDAVHEVTNLRIDQMFEPPGTVSGVSREFLRGVTDDALLILDLESLLQDERLYFDDRHA